MAEIVYPKSTGWTDPINDVLAELMRRSMGGLSEAPPVKLDYPVMLPPRLYREAQRQGIDLTGFVEAQPPEVPPT